VKRLEEADVVLVSCASKTPASIYLANHGIKTGNDDHEFLRMAMRSPRSR
jgi:hypothetical protein